MNDLLSIMARQGYALTFGLLFAEALGLPFPAAIALVAAGGAVAGHTLFLSGGSSRLNGRPFDRRLGAVLARTLLRLGPVGVSLPPFDESRNLHSPFG